MALAVGKVLEFVSEELRPVSPDVSQIKRTRWLAIWML